MKITAERRDVGKYTYFTISLHSGEGKDAFLAIKDCRIIDGTKGRFISFPARKDDKDKWWSHVWASDAFQVEAIKACDAAAPKDTRTHAERNKPTLAEMDDDIPF